MLPRKTDLEEFQAGGVYSRGSGEAACFSTRFSFREALYTHRLTGFVHFSFSQGPFGPGKVQCYDIREAFSLPVFELTFMSMTPPSGGTASEKGLDSHIQVS